MNVRMSVTTTTRRRRMTDGSVREYKQYYVNYRDPVTGGRVRRARDTRRDAEALKADLIARFAAGTYVDERTVPTVAAATTHWLLDREGKVKASTLAAYRVVCRAITGPLLEGTRQERHDFTETGVKPKNAKLVRVLGEVKITDLTPAMILVWHRAIVEHCGIYTANRAESHLKTILALAEEDFGVRAPSMPVGPVRVCG